MQTIIVLLFQEHASVQFSRSVVSDSLWPHESQHARPPCPSPTPGVRSDSHPSSQWCHLILCCPLLLLPPIPPSIRVFSNESALLMRWPKYWSFSFSISPSNEHPGLISFRIDWLDLLACLLSITGYQALFQKEHDKRIWQVKKKNMRSRSDKWELFPTRFYNFCLSSYNIKGIGEYVKR